MNKRLTTGIIMLLPILAAAFFGPVIAPYPKNHSEAVRYEITMDGKELVAPPTPPSADYLLGTNKGGKDMLSLLLYGARWTVGTTLVLAALKVFLGGIIGLAGAFRKQRRTINLHSGPLNALPQIVFLYFVLAKISINFPFNEMILVSIFGIIILIFGTPASAAAIEAASVELSNKEYFTAARASGAGNPYLIYHHILPFLKERLLILFVSEIISVLNTIGQMGIFGVFLGASVMTFSPLSFHSRLHEWAGLVGQARFYIYNDQWILFAPLGAYVFFLLSLYFILEGMKISFQKTYRL